jgi:hypothetical protein
LIDKNNALHLYIFSQWKFGLEKSQAVWILFMLRFFGCDEVKQNIAFQEAACILNLLGMYS